MDFGSKVANLVGGSLFLEEEPAANIQRSVIGQNPNFRL